MSIDLDLFYDVEDSDSEPPTTSLTAKSDKIIKTCAETSNQKSGTVHMLNRNSFKVEKSFTGPRTLPDKPQFDFESSLVSHHKSLLEIDLEEQWLLEIKKKKERERLEEDAELNRRLLIVQKMKTDEMRKSNVIHNSPDFSFSPTLNVSSLNTQSSQRRATLVNSIEDSDNINVSEKSEPSFANNRDSSFQIRPRLQPNDALQRALEQRNKEMDKSNTSSVRLSSEKSLSIFKNAAKVIKEQSCRLANLVGKAAHKVVRSEDSVTSEDESFESGQIKYKAKKKYGTPKIFENTKLVQSINGVHSGSVRTMEFSRCGIFMASGGQDGVVHVWVVSEMADEMRMNKRDYKSLTPEEFRKRLSFPNAFPTDDSISTVSSYNYSDYSTSDGVASTFSYSTVNTLDMGISSQPFNVDPFVSYRYHEADILCLSWSKTHFLISSSMDMTVRLFNIYHDNCLCCFRHGDCVPSIAFHPQDERYFVSGSLDGIVRIWNIPDKKVAVWNKLDGTESNLITAVNFCRNGRIVAVGTFTGTCVFYYASQLRYYTQIQVKGSRKNGTPKITGIVQMPNYSNKVLVSSNDSRIRLYDLRDLSLLCKYKGVHNSKSQIKASFNHSGKFIISGSENHRIYIWKTSRNLPSNNLTRRDKNQYYECIRAHSGVVSCALFAPKFDYFARNKNKSGEIFVSADVWGNIKVFKIRWRKKAFEH